METQFKGNIICGKGRIRTCEPRREWIYSPSLLTTQPPSHKNRTASLIHLRLSLTVIYARTRFNIPETLRFRQDKYLVCYDAQFTAVFEPFIY